jgi:hypothetical protein
VRNFEIISRDQLDCDKYSDLLKHSQNNLIYSELSYLDAVSVYTKSKLFFVLEISKEQYFAAVPFSIFDGVLGPVINSLPFYGSNGGIIWRRNESYDSDKIINEIFDFARRIKCISLTIIESPLSPINLKSENAFNFQDYRIGLMNYFEPAMPAQKLLDTFEDPRPRNIRKAEGAGVTVIESHSLDSITFLAETHIDNIRSVGGIPKNLDFFLQFLNKLPRDQWIILEAIFDGKRIASLLLLYNKNVVEYFTPATMFDFRILQAQSLLIYKGMQFAILNQIYIWNWGGTWPSQKGVYDFKRKWGSRESTYRYFCAVFDETILLRKKEELLKLYPNFYVVPFTELKVQ